MNMLKKCWLCDQVDPLQFRSGAYFCDECIKRHPDTLSAEIDEPNIFKPDAKASFNLYPPDNGGRNGPFAGPQIGCPISIEGKAEGYNDCRILVEDKVPIYPGDTFTAPMAFLCPDLVAPWLKVGMKFKLWEAHFIGEGEILEVYYQGSCSTP